MDVSHLLELSTDFNYGLKFLMTLSMSYGNEDDMLLTPTKDLIITEIFHGIKKGGKKMQKMIHWVTKK